MKRIVSLLLIAAFLLPFVSCSRVVIAAPKGKKITITTANTGAEIKPDQQKMIWYVLWGLVPLSDNTTKDLLADVPDGSTVAVQTEMTFIDGLISMFLGFVTIQTHTVGIKVMK